MKRAIAVLLVLLVGALVPLAIGFLPERLPVTPLVEVELPAAAPPAEMTLSALPTGSMSGSAAFAYRGGSFGEEREFAMTAVLVHHPRGDLLFDTGLGRDAEAHARTMPWLMRVLSSVHPGIPAADRLASAGYDTRRLAGVVLTHAHWDHVSGLPDLPGVPVWIDEPERGFVRSGHRMARLAASLGALPYRIYAFDGGPYLGFPRSHDVWGDGSVVLVPAPGHTPGSIVAFVALPSGARYALVGDIVWQKEGIELPAERPWLSRAIVGEDGAAVRESIQRLAAIHARFPEVRMLPAHDARVLRALPVHPDAAR